MARTKNVKKLTKVGKGSGKKELVRRPAKPAKPAKKKPAKKAKPRATAKFKKGDKLGVRKSRAHIERPLKKKTGAPIRNARPPSPPRNRGAHEVEVVAAFIVRFDDDGMMDLRDQAMIAADCAVDIPDIDKAYVELVSDVHPAGHFEHGGERRAKPPSNETPPGYLNPGVALLSKLGSIIAHFAEADSPGGHAFDTDAARALIKDPEVAHWFALMDKAQLIPKPRPPVNQISTVTPEAENYIGRTDVPYDHPERITDTRTGGKLTDDMIDEMEARKHGPLSDAHVRYIARRFLSWPLPDNFAPDGGVSFQRLANEGTNHERVNRPTGTNLLNGDQATQMVRDITTP